MSNPDRAIWERMLAHLRDHHPTICRQWFTTDLEPVGIAEGCFVVRVLTPVKRTYLHEQCSEQFKDAAQSVTGRLLAIRFLDPDEPFTLPANERARPGLRAGGPPASARNGVLPDTRRNEPTGETAAPMSLGARPREGTGEPPQPEASAAGTPGIVEPKPRPARRSDSLVINPDYSFENFVVGPNNRLAHAAAVAVANDPGKAYNPLFVHGGVGLGKTHLLQAICGRILDHSPSAELYYISCEAFVTQFIEAVKAGEMAEFRHKFRDVDVLVIDDIHFLTKLDRSQEEFFHTFNSLRQAQKQIVLSSDAAPEEIPDLEERLISRFQWGLVTKIDPPEYETRIEILKTKAKVRGMELPDDVAAYLAERIVSHIRELEGIIVKLQIRWLVENRSIDLDLARTVLGEHEPKGSELPIHAIIDVVTKHFHLRVTELQSKRRPKSLVLPRQVCMYLARKLTRHSLEEIGGYFGGRDHTTVMHALKAVDRKRTEDATFESVLKGFEAQLAPARGS